MKILERAKAWSAGGDQLVGHGLWLMLANFGAGVFNVLYQRVTSDMLSLGEYASMQALLTQLSFLIIPFSALSTGMVHFTSRMKREGRYRDILRLVHVWLLRVMVISLVVTLVFWLFAGTLSSLFKFGRNAPVLVMCLAFSTLLVMTVLGGVLQGMQYFRGFAVLVVSHAAGRVLFTGLILLLSYRAAGWAVLGNAVASGLVVCVGFAVFFRVLPRGGPDPDPGGAPMMKFATRSLLFLLTYMVLNTGDILIAKRLFDQDDAGRFTQVSVLARLVIWISVPFARAMFPKVAADGVRSRAHQRLLGMTLGISSLAIVPFALAMLAFPERCFGLIFAGTALNETLLSGLRWMVLGMAANGFLNVLLFFELAQNRYRGLTPIPVVAVIYLGLVAATPMDFVLLAKVVCGVNVLALGATCLTAFLVPGEKGEAAHG